MIYLTELENDGADETWKRRPNGHVYLHCPYCSRWFKLGRDFSIDDNGVVSDTVYHICDLDFDDEDEEFIEEEAEQHGWVVRPKLIGWQDDNIFL